MDEGLERVFGNIAENTNPTPEDGERRATLWYNQTTGDVYGVRDGRPRGIPKGVSVGSITISLNQNGVPEPLIFLGIEGVDKARRKVAEQIRDYRTSLGLE